VIMMEIYQKLEQIKRSLDQYFSHPVFKQYIQKPVIDEDKLLLFYALFEEAEIADEKKEKYVVTAMLVQSALDTHDLVTTTECENKKLFVERQLNVIAGDYFSGLYYFILSEIQDLKMVRALATAIKEINEHKIRLYDRSCQSIEAIVESIVIVETALFQRIGEHFQIETWPEISKTYLTYKRLCEEKHKYDKNSQSVLTQFQKKSKSPIDLVGTFIECCNHYFWEINKLLEKSLKYSPAVKQFIMNRIHVLRFSHMIVEEG